MTPKVKKKVGKSPVKSSGVELVPQVHGGAIRRGNPGNIGNPNAPGRPPSVIREKLRGSFEERIPILEEIADGDPVEHFEAAFVNILPHVKCPKCESQMEPSDPAALFMLSIPAKRSARPGDRIKAVDALAKYGLGEKTELSIVSPEVTERLQETVNLVHQRAPELLTELEAIWK